MAKGQVTIKIIGDASSLKRALGESDAGLSGFQSKMQGLGAKMRGIGVGLTAGLTAPIALMGKQAIDAASNLEQSIGAVESVFGAAGAQIQAFGDTAAQSFGLSRREVNETAAILGAQLQSMGRSADEAAGEVITLQQRAADMAATFGGSTTEALEAIGSLMRGERDPIEKYGVSLKQVDINARIAADGLDTSTTAAQKQSEATAAMSILLEQTANVQGQFAQESDTAAGAQARAAAQFENAKATLGEGLLPVMTEVMNIVSALAVRFTELSPQVQKVVLIGGGLLAVLGPLALAFSGIITVVTAAIPVVVAIGAAIGAVSLPVVLVGAAIVGLAVLVAANFDRIKAAVSAAFSFIQANAGTFARGLVAVLTGGLSEVVLLFIRNWDSIRSAVTSGIATVLGIVRGLPGQILGALGNLGNLLYDSGRALLSGFVDGIKSMVGGVKDAVGGVLSSARNLLPFSPAKEGPFSGRGWTLYSGQALAEGLAQGMTSRAGMVATAAGALASAAHPGTGLTSDLSIAASPGRAAVGQTQPRGAQGPPAVFQIDKVVVSNGRTFYEEMALAEALYSPRLV